MKTLIVIDETGYSTLKTYLISCQSAVPEKALSAFSNYSGSFPTTFEEILGKYSWIIEELSKNVFANILDFSKEHSFPLINHEVVCLFFGSSKHLETAKKSCIVYKDLNNDQRIIVHLTLPATVVKKGNGLITAKVNCKKEIILENLIDFSNEANIGDIILTHLATVVSVKPEEELINKLSKIQKDFLEKYLEKITDIKYSSTLKDTNKRRKKYFRP